MDNWLTDITTWLLSLVSGIFAALLEFVHDAALWVFDAILQAFAGILAAIPVPSFMSAGINLSSYFSGFGPYPLYLLSRLHIAECVTVLMAGISFRLLRKIFTFGRW